MHWKKLRIKKAIEQNFICESCGKSCRDSKMFNVHHKTYKRIGHEDMKDLCFLCLDCHKFIHNKLDEKKEQFIKWKRYLRKIEESKQKPKKKQNKKITEPKRRKRCSTCINFEYAYNEKTRKCGYKCKITGKFAKTYKQLIQCSNYKKK